MPIYVLNSALLGWKVVQSRSLWFTLRFTDSVNPERMAARGLTFDEVRACVTQATGNILLAF